MKNLLMAPTISKAKGHKLFEIRCVKGRAAKVRRNFELSKTYFTGQLPFFLHRLGRALKKIWHWFMRITMPNIYERQGHLSDEKIHDLMNLIYDGNPLKYITIVEPNPLYIRVIGAWTLLCQKGGIC